MLQKKVPVLIRTTMYSDSCLNDSYSTVVTAQLGSNFFDHGLAWMIWLFSRWHFLIEFLSKAQFLLKSFVYSAKRRWNLLHKLGGHWWPLWHTGEVDCSLFAVDLNTRTVTGRHIGTINWNTQQSNIDWASKGSNTTLQTWVDSSHFKHLHKNFWCDWLLYRMGGLQFVRHLQMLFRLIHLQQERWTKMSQAAGKIHHNPTYVIVLPSLKIPKTR